MIVAIVFNTDDSDLVDSLSMAAEWDEGITLKHAGGQVEIDPFTFVDEVEVVDGQAVFSVEVD